MAVIGPVHSIGCICQQCTYSVGAGTYTSTSYTSTSTDVLIQQLIQLLNHRENQHRTNEWREEQKYMDITRIANATSIIAESLEKLSADLLQKAYEKAIEDLKHLLES